MKALAPLLLALLLVRPAGAQQDMDAVLEGFDELEAYADVIELAEADSPQDFAQQGWRWHGALGLAASYNLVDHQSSTGTDYAGLSRLRARAQFGLELKLPRQWRLDLLLSGWRDQAYSWRDAQYTPEVLAAYEQVFDLPQARLAGTLGEGWDLSIGRQVAVLGFADQLRVLDVLNPLDNLEPGLADVEDLRLSVAMLRADHHAAHWQFSAFVTPEQRFSRNPPYGSDFYSLVNSEGEALRLRQIQPRSFDDIDTAVAAIGRFSGWDLSLLMSHHWHDEPYLDARAVDYNDPATDEAAFSRDAVLRHARIWMAGFGLQRSLGSWIFKQEAAWLDGLHYTSSREIEAPLASLPLLGGLLGSVLVSEDASIVPSDVRESAELQALLGLEFFGLAYTTMSVEVSARRIMDFAQDLAWSGYREWRGETALRLSRDLLKERLRVHAIAVLLHDDLQVWRGDGGAIYRFNGEYDLGRGLVVGGGVLLYQRGDQAPWTVSADNDRVFADLRWSF